MKPRRLLRPKATYEKFGCGKTKFDEDYRFHSADDPYVTGAPGVKRLKPVPLGERNIGYLEHEADALINALAKAGGHSESKAGNRRKAARTTQVFLTDALPPRLERDHSTHRAPDRNHSEGE